MSHSTRLTIHTDGAARGNPGPAGIGIVIVDEAGKHVARIARYLGRTTNNQAEYRALLLALETASAFHPQHLEIHLDSELIVRQLQGIYRVRSTDLRPLFERSKQLLQGFPSSSIHHVPREANREADALANRAIDEAFGRAVDKD